MDGRTSLTHFLFVQADREHRVNVSVLPCSPQKTNVDLEKYNRVQKKLRRGANHLHKQPKKDNTMAKAEPTSKVRPVRIASNFCGWTDKKLRRVACCLYCDNGDDKDKARIESMIETVQTGAIDVLEGLRAKLEQLIQTLHRQENKSSVSSENSEEKASQTQNATTAIRELTKADERSICGKFVHMVQDKQLHLTGDQQVAIAHGIMQMLKDLNLSDSSVGSTEACPHNKSECREVDVNGGHGDPENDSGYNGSDAEGEDVHGGAEETGQHDIGENSREPMDRARTG